MSLHEPRARLLRRNMLTGVVLMLGVGTLPRIVIADESPVGRFVGTFDYAGTDAERSARDKAIDALVDKMTPVARGIARKKLQEATAIPPHLTIDADAKTLTITDARAMAGHIDGTPVKVKGYEDAELELTYEITKTGIVQHLRGDAKGEARTYSLDGTTLRVHIDVYASQLPANLDYDLTFARPKKHA